MIISISVAIAATQQTAQASYSFYLWCLGSGMAGFGLGVWVYDPDLVIDPAQELACEWMEQLQQSYLIVHALWQNVLEQTTSINTNQKEQHELYQQVIDELKGTVALAHDTTISLEPLIVPLQDLHASAVQQDTQIQAMDTQLRDDLRQLHHVAQQTALLQQRTASTIHACESQQDQLHVVVQQTQAKADTLSQIHRHLCLMSSETQRAALEIQHLKQHIESLEHGLLQEREENQRLRDENDVLSLHLSALRR